MTFRSLPYLSLTLLTLACGGDDTTDPSRGDGGPDDSRITASELFDTGVIHDISVQVQDSDWQSIQNDPLAETYIPAEMTLGTHVQSDASIRYKGGFDTLQSCVSAEPPCPKLSFKLRFNGQNSDGRFAGLRRFNLHSAVRDSTMAREIIAYEMYRRMGIAAPRATHAKLTVNGEYQGLFVLVEAIDKEFVEDNFSPGEGNLYKETWPRFENPGEYVNALRTNEAAMEVARMASFYETVENTSDQSFTSDIASFIDLETMGRYLAVDRAISNYDGISVFYCDNGTDICFNHNNYWYENQDGHFNLMPWDMDRVMTSVNTELGLEFEDRNENGCNPYSQCDIFPGPGCETGSTILPSQCDPLFGYTHRATWSTSYKDALGVLLDGTFADVAALRPVLKAKIESEIASDPFHAGSEAFEEEHENLQRVLDAQLPAIQNRFDLIGS